MYTSDTFTDRIFHDLTSGNDLHVAEWNYLESLGFSTLPATPHQTVKRLFAAGFSTPQIIELCNLFESFDTETVLDLLDQMPPDLPVITKLHAQGWTPLQIAEETSLPRANVYYHLEDLGLTPNRTKAPEVTVAQHRKIILLVDQGLPYSDIARRVGVSYDQVRAAIRRSGR